MERFALLGKRLIRCFRLDYLIQRDKKTVEDIGILYAREDRKTVLERLWQERIGILFVMFFCILFLVLVVSWQEEGGELTEGQLLSRENEEVTLSVTMNQEGEQLTENMTFSIGERELTDTEMAELSKKVEEELKNKLPGNNANLMQVSQKLYLPDILDFSPVKIQWMTDTDYLKEDGSLQYENIPKDGVRTSVTASASYKNWKQDYTFSIYLIPTELSDKQKMHQIVKKQIQQSISSQRDKDILTLPEKADDITISYQLPDDENTGGVWFLLCIPILLPFYWREQLKKKKEIRNYQLMMDYPEMINKIMLLLAAGLTIRSSMERMAGDYEKKYKEGGEFRYLYEEIALVCNEIRNGMSESRAIERFGVRCQLLPYLRFSTLVTQNMRKGTAGLLEQFEREALDSLEQRRELVKQMGEEAGTKLLLPMGIMLILVMGIIMIPAFCTL